MAENVAGGFTSYEMLLLPLAGENGAAGAISSMARVAGHEETNRIRARIVSQWIRSLRFLPDEEHPAPVALPAAHMLAPSADRSPRRYRHLTVLSGGK